MDQTKGPGINQRMAKDGSHLIICKEENKEDENRSYLREAGQRDYQVDRQNSTKIRSTVIIILVALPLLLVAILLGWIIIPCLIRQQISNRIVISPETNAELYSAWLHPPIPVFLKVYIFNVTNPKEVRAGKLPKLKELGPYVFQENRTKTDVSLDDASDTATYKERITFHYRQDLSEGVSLDDVVTLINVPFVAAAIKISHDLPWPVSDIAKTVLLSYKEPLFIQKPVEEALFKGWKVPFLEKLEEQTGLSLVPNNQFGLLVEQNDTVLGPATISRGTTDKSSFGQFLKYKNESHLDFWGDSTSPCNKVQGTDGTIFPPFVTKSTTLRLFNPELCRSLYLTYYSSTEFDGIKGYRFKAPHTVFENPRLGGENHCFCANLEDDEEEDECLRQGAFNLGPCRDGAPVAMSIPHFLYADQEYVEESGLTPDSDKHETFLDIEPTTGLILQASKRLQINLILKKVKDISSLSKVPDMLFPLVWADECASLNEEYSSRFKTVLFSLWLVDFLSKWVLLLMTLILSVVLILRILRRHVYQKGPTNDCNDKCNTLNGAVTEKLEATSRFEDEVRVNGSSWFDQKIPLAVPEETEFETQ